uniref:telomeric repeat-binding factor 2-interacting protein 1 isoform X1 n=1 Tax=Gasterosteus aculeatus aculeatus TaxID=481459 RepID=UPI001A982C3F|nr:telomeric repeat-binding factor 2-interacting protein 1 isoform X1 [Gasterosteus aculeatus aculeatus]
MVSEQQNGAKRNISPVLFMTVDGEPMTFFLRPGPAKLKLQPLITAGAGVLCKVQQPGAILLLEPEERGSISESTTHWFVSTQYIFDCIEKNEQLNLEDYKLNPVVVPRQSARLNNKKEISTGHTEGRLSYSAEDDAAILTYVSKHKSETGGNRLWQEMEKQSVTSHSWQSMKSRYKARLAKSEVVKVATTEEDTKPAESKTKGTPRPPDVRPRRDTRPPAWMEDYTVSLPAHHSPSRQVDASHKQGAAAHCPIQPEYVDAAFQSMPASPRRRATTPEILGALHGLMEDNLRRSEQRLGDLEKAGHKVKAQTEDLSDAPESGVIPHHMVKDHEETAVQKASRPEDPASAQTRLMETDQTQVEEVKHVDPQADEQPSESKCGEAAEAETSNSPHPEGPCLDPQTDTAESGEPEAEEPQTHVMSPQKSAPCGSPPAEPEYLHDTSSPKKSKEKQKVSPKLDQLERRATRRQLAPEMPRLPEPYSRKLRSSTTSPGRPPASPQPSKKTKSALQVDTVGEQPPPKRPRGDSGAAGEEETGEAAVPETQAGTESNSAPQKKKEKRKLGILEMAIKEFEDGSESDEDAGPDIQTPTEAAATRPTSAERLPPPSDTATGAVSTASSPELVASPQGDTQEAEPPAGNGLPAPVASEAVDAPSKVHLFIFDSESQEDSQSIIGDHPVAPSKPRAAVHTDAVLSLTQVQLDEDKQRIKELMSQTNQDLVSVTKALLKTSGDFSAALEQLLNPTSISGPVWNRCDDSLLFSADPEVRQQLREKYGEQDVAKRIVFLEAEG